VRRSYSNYYIPYYVELVVLKTGRSGASGATPPVRCWSYGTQNTHVRFYVHTLLPLAFIEFVAQLLACKLVPLGFCVHWLTEERGQQQSKMENGTLHELLNTISSLHQWECTLNFPDLRCPEGFVNLCWIQVPGNSNFPAGCYYCFDDKLYGEGLNSAKKLVNDIYQSARKSGFTLIIGSSDSNRIGDLWMKRIRLVCKRAKVYEESKLAEINNQKESTGLMALSDISNTDDTTKKRRKTLTQRATCADEKCQFQITLYLHKYHNKWYIKLSSDTPALHLGHRELLPNEIATSSKMLLAADIDTLKMHSSIHLSSTLIRWMIIWFCFHHK